MTNFGQSPGSDCHCGPQCQHVGLFLKRAIYLTDQL
jgi:hypothetical protein